MHDTHIYTAGGQRAHARDNAPPHGSQYAHQRPEGAHTSHSPWRWFVPSAVAHTHGRPQGAFKVPQDQPHRTSIPKQAQIAPGAIHNRRKTKNTLDPPAAPQYTQYMPEGTASRRCPRDSIRLKLTAHTDGRGSQ
jgi:hypothetical protein